MAYVFCYMPCKFSPVCAICKIIVDDKCSMNEPLSVLYFYK